MKNLAKINFDMENYNYEFACTNEESKNLTKIKVFEQPQAGNFLTIFILISKFQETNLAQLVNCITSIKIQTFTNVNIELINLDTSRYTENIIKKVAYDTNSQYKGIKSANILQELEKILTSNESDYICLFDYQSLFPRIKELENIVNLLFNEDYDYLSLKINYTTIDNIDFNFPENNNRLLKSTENYHYSVFFKRNKLKTFDFSQLKTNLIDLKILEELKNKNLNGNHLTSKTKINLLGKLNR